MFDSLVPDTYRVVNKGDGAPKFPASSLLNPFAHRYSHAGHVINISAHDSPKGLSLSKALCKILPEGISDLLTFRFLLEHREPEYRVALLKAVHGPVHTPHTSTSTSSSSSPSPSPK